MDEAWAKIGSPDQAKFSINSLIGLWCLDTAYAYKLRSSTNPNDQPGECLQRTTHIDDEVIA